jgi:hypothetical protein
MNHSGAVIWRAADIAVTLEEDLSEGDIATVMIGTPAGKLEVMARIVVSNRTIRLLGLHIRSPDIAPGDFGLGNLRRAGGALLEWFGDYDELVIEGAVRTSGAKPGHRPRVIRIARNLRPQEEPS